MGDPATVIDQYRRYVQDGRLEISEVMASELSDLLLSKKGRSLAEQGHLVTALRDLAKIQEMRTKWKESRAAASMLVKSRKRYVKLLKANGMQSEAKSSAKAEAAAQQVLQQQADVARQEALAAEQQRADTERETDRLLYEQAGVKEPEKNPLVDYHSHINLIMTIF